MTAAVAPRVVPDPAAAERRGWKRRRTWFATGPLTTAGREQVCRVRTPSGQGVGIEPDGPPPAGER